MYLCVRVIDFAACILLSVSLDCLSPVSFMANVACVSGLS